MQVGVKRAEVFAQPLVRRARAMLKHLGQSRCELSLSLISDTKMKALNRTWRHKDVATDVLSFPTPTPVLPGQHSLGDVVISVDTARRMARELNTSVSHELELYLAHGILHLLGHDHLKKRDAQKMEKAEQELLGLSGMLGRSGEAGWAEPKLQQQSLTLKRL
jgi:probable rRNA maturation factor